MTYRHFGDYVSGYGKFSSRTALTTKPFLKIERLNYQALQNRAYQVSNFLRDKGIRPGDRVMITALNTPNWIELLLGVQLIGAVLVPVDVTSSAENVLGYYKLTRPVMVFKNDSLHTELDSLDMIFSIEKLDILVKNQPTTPPRTKLNGDMPGFIFFTSGTTADPKGVVLTQQNILSNVSGIQDRIDIDPNWRSLSVLPLSHTYEMTSTLAFLSKGCGIYYIPRITPSVIVKALVQYQITTIVAVPQLLSLLLEQIRLTATSEGKIRLLSVTEKISAKLPFSMRKHLFRSVHSRLGGHLELVVTGGAPIPLDVAKAWESMGVKMIQGYGLTETSPILTVNSLKQRHLGSPGRPLDNLQLRISDSGEIQARGPNVFKSYLNNPKTTKSAFTSDGWFKTGDVGRLDNGWLHIQGRLKFAIVRSSGLKVFPEDIELITDKHPTFKELCIVGLKNGPGEKVMAIIISDKSNQEINQAIDEVNAQLESHQHIDLWQIWPEKNFPRTRLLKVDRKEIEVWANKHILPKARQFEQSSGQQDQLFKIISLSLGSRNDLFNDSDRLADIGLDSLRRLNMVSLIEAQLGVTIPEENVTQSSKIKDIRQLINLGDKTEVNYKRSNWTFNKSIRILGNGVRDFILWPIVRLWVKMDVKGRENLTDLNEPALFIFNHSDDFDGPVIYKCLPRNIRKRLTIAAADDVMNEHKFLALIIKFCFAGFNFARIEPYMPSLDYVGKVIDKGWHVVISPEGKIAVSGKLQPFKPGIGLLAVSLGTPVVVIKTFGLTGTVPLHSRWPKKRSRITVRINKPISFDVNSDFDKVANQLHKIMENL